MVRVSHRESNCFFNRRTNKMKKITAIALALVMLLSFAACGGEKAPAAYEGTLTELCTKMYEANPVEFAVMTEGMEIDLSDTANLEYYLGITNVEDVKEAIFSESMIGAQAYSLVLARVNDASKTEEIKASILEKVNPRKWICVEADQLRVASSGDLIMFVMVDSKLGDTIADGMVTAFETNVGGLTGETLKQG